MRIASLLLALVLSAPAYAEFTPQEKTSLKHLREAINRTLRVAQYNCGNYGNEPECQQIFKGAYEEFQCLGWLLGVNVNPADAAGDNLLAGPRATVVTTAWSDCDRAVYELNLASVFVNNIDYQQIGIQLAQVDRSLAYADPFPTFNGNPLGTDPQNQFGPHGHYSVAQKDLWKVMQYGQPAIVSGWLAGMRANAMPASTGVVSTYARILNIVKDVQLLSAHVIDPAEVSGYLGYLTDAEAVLPDEALRALLELHLVFGPVDGPAQQSASYLFRFVDEPAATALKTFFLSDIEAEILGRLASGEDWSVIWVEYETLGYTGSIAEVNALILKMQNTAKAGPFIYEFLRRRADSWQHLDRWGGDFTVIR